MRSEGYSSCPMCVSVCLCVCVSTRYSGSMLYVSGNPAMPKTYLAESQRSSASHGDMQQNQHTAMPVVTVVFLAFGMGFRSTFGSLK